MLLLKKRRIESPTSVLTYLQCPRKYFYRYIKELDQIPNIHLIRGGIAHSTIEAFHNTNITTLDLKGFLERLQGRMLKHFNEKWEENKKEIARCGLTPEEKLFYYDETKAMLTNFYHHYTTNLLAYKYCYDLGLPEAHQKLKPKTETKLTSETYGVRGRIDATHELDGETIIIEYKTSKKNELNVDCVIQLAPYLPDFPYNPTEARFIGKPIDLIVFRGMDEKDIQEVIFVEVKSGKSRLNPIEKNLKEIIKNKEIRWVEYRIPEELNKKK